MTSFPLTLRAGPTALALIRERGLRAEDVDILVGASGGAKWLALAGIDQWLFPWLTATPRVRPLHGIGSSIGSWRMACLAQQDPLAALARGHEAYIEHQRYSAKPDVREVTDVLSRALDHLLGPRGAIDVASNPDIHVHVITAEARGLLASDRRPLLASALMIAAAANAVSRRSLGWQLRRTIFHTAGDRSPFLHLRDLPTVHRALTASNARQVLLASGSIPLLLEGVRIPDAPGVHWDGGVTDYHPDLDFGAGDGLVLFPHFFEHIVPGWFDKAWPWRRGRRYHDRTLLIAPSVAFVAALPGRKIPDRRDFYTMTERERLTRWRTAAEMSRILGDTLHELIVSNHIGDFVHPW